MVSLLLKFKSDAASFVDFRDLRKKKTEHKNVTVFFRVRQLNVLSMSSAML